MNWNKVGWLANQFADHDAAVICGRYTHSSFWNEPHLIDEDDPILGMAQHYLLCPFNHSTKTLGRSEEHTSELQSLMRISYAVFCLKKKKYIIIKSLEYYKQTLSQL